MSGVYTLAPTGERIYEGQSLFGSTPDFDDPDFEVKQPGHSTKKKDGEPPTIFDMLLQRQKETIRPLESYSLFVGPKGGGKSSLLALLQPLGLFGIPQNLQSLSSTSLRAARRTLVH